MSHGMKVFETLQQAKDLGYEVYDRTPTGWLVRVRTLQGWALALVEPRQPERAKCP